MTGNRVKDIKATTTVATTGVADGKLINAVAVMAIDIHVQLMVN